MTAQILNFPVPDNSFHMGRIYGAIVARNPNWEYPQAHSLALAESILYKNPDFYMRGFESGYVHEIQELQVG